MKMGSYHALLVALFLTLAFSSNLTLAARVLLQAAGDGGDGNTGGRLPNIFDAIYDFFRNIFSGGDTGGIGAEGPEP